MLFRRLMEYGKGLEDGYAYYQRDESTLVVDIDSTSGKVQPIHMGTEGQPLAVPKVNRTSGNEPFLLVEGPEYVFGMPVGKGERRARRAEKRHAAYRELLNRCADETGSSAVGAVADLVSDADALSLLEARLLPGKEPRVLTEKEAKQWIAFRADGSYVHDQPDVAAFWAREVERSSATGEGRCSVCARRGPLAKKNPVKAKGVGAAAVTSANEPAFVSFGLEKHGPKTERYRTTSVCLSCAYRVTVAFNDLMDWKAGGGRSLAATHNRGGSHRIGDAKLAYWSTGDPGFAVDIMRCLENPSSADVAELFRSPRTGRTALLPADAGFHSFTASGYKSRVVFRDWIDVPLREVQANVHGWVERVNIVGQNGEPAAVGIGQLLASTVHPRKDIRAADGLALWRTALLGAPFPQRLQAAAVRRASVERRMTTSRAAILKAAVLDRTGLALRNNDHELENDRMNDASTGNLTRLNPDHPSPAYHLGRLLAVLDDIQYQAQKIRTVVDRNVGGATSSPMAVFPRLLEMARKAHLPKIERAEETGRRHILQRRLEGLIPEKFPRRLGLEDKSLFMVGLYHEEADRRARIAAAIAQKERGGG
ncbi:MAG: type I-C CRISPR-associated protein Cas8c/Csd1 [Gammaproteobacteria bacterium]|nr:type I-C CRISPR-associated protein Cas8c/Csd1 [Gammaproteobacteria bacterium]MDE0260011.1 type I-C CRISPR-associated protein Cas8c/Csd1 [Gammaproteobacteria bacterium]